MPDITPLALARFELRRLRGLLPTLALGFVLLIPLLYGCIYLAGNWDPYGRMDNVPVAVVNQDRPVTVNGKLVQAGQDFVDSLHETGTFRFIDTDATEASTGLQRGDYYLVISVPETFSANLVSASDYDPKRAQIMLHRNDANGFVIGTITNSAQNSIAKAIDETAVKSYFEAVFANLTAIRESLVAAADGATRIDDGLTQAKDGSGKLRTGAADAAQGATRLADGAGRLSTGLDDAAAGAASLATGLATLDTGAQRLAEGSSQVAGGTQALADVVDPVLTLAAERLPEAQQRVTSAADKVTYLSGQVASGSGTVAGIGQDIDDAMAGFLETHPELADDPIFEHVKGHTERLASVSEEIAGVADTVATDVAAADQALNEAGDLSQRATDAKSKVDALNAGAQQVASGAAELSTGLGQARTGAEALNDGMGQAKDGAGELSSGTQTLADGLDALSSGAAALDDGLGQLTSGSHELATKLTQGAQQIPVLTDKEAADAVSVMSAPVDVSMEVDNPAHVYGRGLAPMFFSIALWVLGISAFFLVRPITGRVLAGRGSDLRIALTAWLTLAGISVVAGWLMLGAAWVGLGLDPVHPWLMILLVTLVALAFSSVAHLMRTGLGLVATAGMLILLIIQLTAAGGTYPPELMPSFFAAIGHVMPMTYTIDAFRIAISGGLMSKFIRDIVLLVALLVSCLALLVLVVHRRRQFRMTDLHPPLG